jgi:adenine deaminase
MSSDLHRHISSRNLGRISGFGYREGIAVMEGRVHEQRSVTALGDDRSDPAFAAVLPFTDAGGLEVVALLASLNGTLTDAMKSPAQPL